MSFNFKEIKESIRIKDKEIKLKVLTFSGKDGDFYVVVSPALLVSGYGDTTEEAEQSFKENLETFCRDLLILDAEQRDLELKKLGFLKEKYHTKNFSKAYVDENGVLQGLEKSSIKTAMLEATV
ncbi:hypothetical protein [Flavobacterium sp.]|uniref:hypothetical protein n=1 Tax=Flavobacterium sp. TaxID=239 RepID=UPI003B9DA33B